MEDSWVHLTNHYLTTWVVGQIAVNRNWVTTIGLTLKGLVFQLESLRQGEKDVVHQKPEKLMEWREARV